MIALNAGKALYELRKRESKDYLKGWNSKGCSLMKKVF